MSWIEIGKQLLFISSHTGESKYMKSTGEMEVQTVRWKYLYCCYFSSEDDEFVDKRNEQVKKGTTKLLRRWFTENDLLCVYYTFFRLCTFAQHHVVISKTVKIVKLSTDITFGKSGEENDSLFSLLCNTAVSRKIGTI